jgi:hypothetical protein
MKSRVGSLQSTFCADDETFLTAPRISKARRKPLVVLMPGLR